MAEPINYALNQDNGTKPELGVLLPAVNEPDFSYLQYICWTEFDLDPGVVLAKPLPQEQDDVDTLAAGNAYAATLGKSVLSVNLSSNSTGSDAVQRGSTSTYRVCLKGSATRAGYPPTIPGLVSVGKVSVVPDRPQNVMGPVIVGNMFGIPILFSKWELWYHIPISPQTKKAFVAPPNLATFIDGDIPLPDKGIQGPVHIPIKNLQPQILQNPIVRQNPLQGPRQGG